MSYWRDDGVGNMAGRDDRQWEEFTLLEKLAVVAGHSNAVNVPFIPEDIDPRVQEIVQQAFEAIEAAHGYPLYIKVDGDREIISICGIKYAFSLFRALGFDSLSGKVFQITRREDGALLLTEHTPGLIGASVGPSTAEQEIERLRNLLRRCQPGADMVDIGDGEHIGLYLRRKSHAAD